MSMIDLELALAAYFHKSEFRPGQKEVITDVINGKDVLAIWPTGAGKSLVYQLPALLLPHLSIVVSPLIALMQDQVQSLHNNQLANVACLTSSQSPQEKERVIHALRQHQIRILFVAPERLVNLDFLELLQCCPVSMLAIDEAHCISQWGHDFRPDYLALGQAIKALKPRAILAVTATATPVVRQQIIEYLGLRLNTVHTMSLDRPNLTLCAQRLSKQERKEALVANLLRPSGTPAIIYTARRADTEQLSSFLSGFSFRCAPYHAGLTANRREVVQSQFQSNALDVVVATVAFGMGIDKPNVRQVLHYSPPPSLEAYYQEAGRAGRDRQPARALLLYSEQDFLAMRQHITAKYPPFDTFVALYQALQTSSPAQLRTQFLSISPGCWRFILSTLYGAHYLVGSVTQPCVSLESAWRYLQTLQDSDHYRLDQMYWYAVSSDCRHQALLNYFGQTCSEACTCCDNCLGSPQSHT